MRHFFSAFTALVIAVASLIGFANPAPAYAADGTVCPPVAGVTYLTTGYSTFANFTTTGAFTVPTGVAGLYVDYRQDVFGVDKHFQPGERVPITADLGWKGTMHGCASSNADLAKGAPQNPTICAAIDGVTFNVSRDDNDKVEPGASRVSANKPWVVPAGMFADYHPDLKVRYNGGETVPKGNSTLFGCTPPSATTTAAPTVPTTKLSSSELFKQILNLSDAEFDAFVQELLQAAAAKK